MIYSDIFLKSLKKTAKISKMIIHRLEDSIDFIDRQRKFNNEATDLERTNLKTAITVLNRLKQAEEQRLKKIKKQITGIKTVKNNK